MAALSFGHLATATPPFLSPLRLNINTPCFHLGCSDFPFTASIRRNSCLITLSYSNKSKSRLQIEKEREFLEQYGLNPDEFLAHSSPQRKRRKGQAKTGENARQEITEEPKRPRETHKLLQVLAGKARRKKLLSPKGMDVRPMMEVVKAAAFAILQAAGGSPASLRPGRWLDLYSGTGSVGIEAISRGCSEAHFVEMDPWVVSDVLRPNLQWTGFLDVSTIHPVRVEDFLERAEQFAVRSFESLNYGKRAPFDYISVTPPYMAVDYGVLMNQISSSSIIGEDTFIVVEYPLKTDMLDSCGCLTKIADRRFGRTHLAIYGPNWAQKRRKSASLLMGLS
ncbi:uncharacterized protein [Coffea arabica]|uniref:Uncharacterized protein LOC113698010 isoform X1 n=1 Tax=Coffea arabica TaxID=13443 RepID=A0A6P6T648_COFAR|nr:uncharacterized protein LOC113698010 isoform X1 [Coffea arabica]